VVHFGIPFSVKIVNKVKCLLCHSLCQEMASFCPIYPLFHSTASPLHKFVAGPAQRAAFTLFWCLRRVMLVRSRAPLKLQRRLKTKINTNFNSIFLCCFKYSFKRGDGGEQTWVYESWELGNRWMPRILFSSCFAIIEIQIKCRQRWVSFQFHRDWERWSCKIKAVFTSVIFQFPGIAIFFEVVWGPSV